MGVGRAHRQDCSIGITKTLGMRFLESSRSETAIHITPALPWAGLRISQKGNMRRLDAALQFCVVVLGLPFNGGLPVMNWKFARFAAAFLPICFLSAQNADQANSRRADRKKLQPPSEETRRWASEEWNRMRARAIVINDLAGHIQSRDDAQKLVDLVADEFSDGLPPRWATRAIRNRIARAEFASATDPGALIPEQRVADAWNDYLQKIGAPQGSFVTAAEIHTLRDSYYTTSQVLWAQDGQNIWMVPNFYAVGSDGKVANGCRALEVLNIVWQLANQPELLQGTCELIDKGQRTSDFYKDPKKPRTPGSDKGTVILRQMPPNPVYIAGQHYTREHGIGALNSAIEGLLNELFEG